MTEQEAVEQIKACNKQLQECIDKMNAINANLLSAKQNVEAATKIVKSESPRQSLYELFKNAQANPIHAIGASICLGLVIGILAAAIPSCSHSDEHLTSNYEQVK
jgi:ElaB/YqjD/DUF883 family membrane-anchored ribosome-binding protein